MKIIAYICLCVGSVLCAQVDSLNLEDIFLKNKFKANSRPALKFVKSGSQYVTVDKGYLRFWNTATGKKLDSVEVPIDKDKVEDFEYHEQTKKVLVKYGVEPIYRRSYQCNVLVYDLLSRKLVYLGNGDKLVNPEWSHDGKKLGYTFQNNLYYYDLEKDSSIKVTQDGAKNQLLNGQADWVYEEEFEITKAYWWNAKGTQIAYLKFDESAVRTFTLQYWKSDLYPTDYTYKYPKVGEAPSKVSLWIYDLATGKHDSLYASEKGYLPRVGWTPDGTLFFYTLNRFQNRCEVLGYDKGKLRSWYSEESKTYVEIDGTLWTNAKALYFTSYKTGYRHVYQLNYSDKKCTVLTSGNWDVLEIQGLSDDHIYYTRVGSGTHTHVLVAQALKGGKMYPLNTSGSATLLSHAAQYVVVAKSSLMEPISYVLLSQKLEMIRVLDDQKALKDKLGFLASIEASFASVPLKGYEVSTLVLKSKNFDRDSKHPVLLFQYSGPGYQVVVDEWKGTTLMWFAYLIEKGYVVVLVDPRGTGARGEAYKKSTYLQLGMQESEDMAFVSQYLSLQPYVDARRIHIFGWSFGGYVAALAATKWSGYFDKAVSVAPVTDWRYYDNVYTERYMQTPETNAKGYDTSSVMKYTKNMNTRFLLLHGTADDNVHIQNSYALQKALLTHNKQFDYFVFADKNHSIAGANTRYYLYRKVTDFLLKE